MNFVSILELASTNLSPAPDDLHELNGYILEFTAQLHLLQHTYAEVIIDTYNTFPSTTIIAECDAIHLYQHSLSESDAIHLYQHSL